MPALRLNQTNVSRLDFPSSGVDVYLDDQTEGFRLEVTQAGRKIWKLYKRIGGVPRRVTLGKFPSVSADKARKLCLQLLGDLARGETPESSTKGGPSIGDLWEDYLENHAKPRKKSWRQDVGLYEKNLQKFEKVKLQKVDRAFVSSIHQKLRATPYTANRVLSLLRKMFEYAAEGSLTTGPNPCRGVRKYKERERTRFLRKEEAPGFLKALEGELPVFRDLFQLCLLTGARKSNVLSMRFEALDLGESIWVLPETKNGEEIVLHLPEAAKEILHRRRAEVSGAWVFPGSGKSGHLEDPKASWKRIQERAGLQDLQIHDLRRTLGSWQAIGGSSLLVIGQSLGHKSQASTAIYARLTMGPVRDSVEKALEGVFQD